MRSILYSPQHIVKNIFSSDLSLQNAPQPCLINETYIVGSPPKFVLQWVNPIFSPLIHDDLDVITKHLEAKGLTTPLLYPLPNGDLCYPDEDKGYWLCGLLFLKQYLPYNGSYKKSSGGGG